MHLLIRFVCYFQARIDLQKQSDSLKNVRKRMLGPQLVSFTLQQRQVIQKLLVIANRNRPNFSLIVKWEICLRQLLYILQHKLETCASQLLPLVVLNQVK